MVPSASYASISYKLTGQPPKAAPDRDSDWSDDSPDQGRQLYDQQFPSPSIAGLNPTELQAKVPSTAHVPHNFTALFSPQANSLNTKQRSSVRQKGSFAGQSGSYLTNPL